MLALIAGGLVAVGLLYGLYQICMATLPDASDGSVDGMAATAWMRWWGLALALVAGGWSGTLVVIQWRQGVEHRASARVEHISAL